MPAIARPQSAAATLRSLQPHLPAALVSADARNTLEDILDGLPAALSRRFYFECRLAAGRSEVDVILAAARAEWPALAACDVASRDTAAAPLWAGIAALARTGIDPHDGRHSAVGIIWLEFDAPPRRAHAASLIPGVFLTRSGVDATARGALVQQLDTFARIRGTPFTRQTVRACHRALANLPPVARVVHVGVMYPRDPGAVRICVSHLTGAPLLTYLTTIGWPGRLQDVQETMRALGCPSVPDPIAAVTLVHLDIGDDVQPRLGLELPFRADAQLTGLTAETDLLHRVTALRLGAPEKCAAAASWPRRTRVWLDHLGSVQPLVCRLSNLKVVWNGSTSPEIKIYLSAFHGTGVVTGRAGVPCSRT